jgi:hypothetical protein
VGVLTCLWITNIVQLRTKAAVHQLVVVFASFESCTFSIKVEFSAG